MAATDPPAAPLSSRLRRDDASRAVDALLKWTHAQPKRHKAQLLDHDDLLYLVLTLKKIPHKGRTNAFRIPLPHSLYDDDSTSTCLLVDDRRRLRSPDSPAITLDLARSLALPVSEVIPLSKLRSDYRPFEARRRLCDSHDLFFADRRVIPLLPRLLGKHFFKKKKIPVPLELGRTSWPEQLRQCLRSTLLYLRSGTCSGVKVGRVSQSREEIVDNVMAAIEGAVQHVPKKWSNLRSLHLKSAESLALPIYQALPEMGLKIEAFPKKEKKPEEDGAVEDDGAQEEKKKKSQLSSRKITPEKGRIPEVQLVDDEFELDSDDLPEDADLEEDEDEDFVAEKKMKKKGKKDRKEKMRGLGENDNVEGENKEEDEETDELGLGKRETKKRTKGLKFKKKETALEDGVKEKKDKIKTLDNKKVRGAKRSNVRAEAV